MAVLPQIYLINQATFVGYEDISVNIEATRLNVFIKKAQDLDLKPFLKGAFFFDLINNVVLNTDGTIKTEDQATDEAPLFTEQKYVDLLLGAQYTDRYGNDQYFDGLIPALLYWTFARFIEADYVRYTATGPVQKTHDEAKALSTSDIAKLVSQQRSVANAHANEVVLFMDAMNYGQDPKVYPLWRFSERNAQSRQPGPRIRAVDRTDVKGSGYYNRTGFDNSLFY